MKSSDKKNFKNREFTELEGEEPIDHSDSLEETIRKKDIYVCTCFVNSQEPYEFEIEVESFSLPNSEEIKNALFKKHKHLKPLSHNISVTKTNKKS